MSHQPMPLVKSRPRTMLVTVVVLALALSALAASQAPAAEAAAVLPDDVLNGTYTGEGQPADPANGIPEDYLVVGGGEATWFTPYHSWAVHPCITLSQRPFLRNIQMVEGSATADSIKYTADIFEGCIGENYEIQNWFEGGEVEVWYNAEQELLYLGTGAHNDWHRPYTGEPVGGMDCGDGFVLTADEVDEVEAGIDQLVTAGEMDVSVGNAVKTDPCAAIALLLSQSVTLVAAEEPGPTLVAGFGAGTPIGQYGRPDRIRPDGTASAYPYYTQAYQYKWDSNNYVQTPDLVNRALRWLQERIGVPVTELMTFHDGDLLAELRVNVAVATDGTKITAVDPPAGGQPDWDPTVTPRGQLLGFTQPDGLLAFSHGFMDQAGCCTFVSRAEAKFTYSAPGNLQLPVDVEFTALEPEVKITVYKDGTWDYAVSDK